MNTNRTIEKILGSWGKSKRHMPANNSRLKSEILSEVPNHYTKVASSRPRPTPWLSFGFAVMAVFVFLVNMTDPKNVMTDGLSKVFHGGVYNTVSNGMMVAPSEAPTPPPAVREESMTNQSPSGVTAPSIAYNQGAYDSYSPPYYGGGEPTISDTREFLKTNYNATIQTRDVGDMTMRVENIVHILDGRVDGSSSGETSGYVNFAIPKSELGSFKLQLRDLVGVRFYTEQSSSQNLLADKQMIEESQKQTEKNLNDLKTERAQIVRAHNQNISLYQTQVDSIRSEMTVLNIEYPSATPNRKVDITNRINQLQVEINTVTSQITSENKNYQSRLGGIDSKINNTNENLSAIQKQDTTLIDSVATVSGYISITHINVWEMVDAYLPGPLLAWILIVVALVSYVWYRRSLAWNYF
jgi:uncharacterized protein